MKREDGRRGGIRRGTERWGEACVCDIVENDKLSKKITIDCALYCSYHMPTKGRLFSQKIERHTCC